MEEIMAEKENKTIIFVETKKRCDELTRRMRRDGWPAMCIHGDKSQPERDWVLTEFRSGKAPILIATDVASRGLGMSSQHGIHTLTCSHLHSYRAQHTDSKRIHTLQHTQTKTFSEKNTHN
ncbi:unnamed protein product [Oncorhynchus mykiss]|nr:unnamed protein product [Oncorhynchus mykiss]